MTGSQEILLAIEAAILGGSISVIVNGRETANYIGSKGTARAEELLPRIDELLRANGIQKSDIGLIAVSAGPGSFTGIRIGIATALGLKAGLGIEFTSHSVLRAMAFDSGYDGQIVAAVPMGRQGVGFQTFKALNGVVDALGEPRALNEDEFCESLKGKGVARLVAHTSLKEILDKAGCEAVYLENLALAIGKLCIAEPSTALSPIFLSKGN